GRRWWRRRRFHRAAIPRRGALPQPPLPHPVVSTLPAAACHWRPAVETLPSHLYLHATSRTLRRSGICPTQTLLVLPPCWLWQRPTTPPRSSGLMPTIVDGKSDDDQPPA